MADGLDAEPLDAGILHLCLDMQNLFAPNAPWSTPWMPRVLPVVTEIAGRFPERTVFTRFIPPDTPEAAPGKLKLTQEFLSQMLGVRRSSVSIVAGTLQNAGFIKYSRGHIRLLDVAQIEQGACECYGAVKAHYRRLLAK